jgi:hypothetical protein
MEAFEVENALVTRLTPVMPGAHTPAKCETGHGCRIARTAW